MDSFSLFLTLFYLACGAYCLYVWGRLQFGGGLFNSPLLIPKDRTPGDCLDPEGYARYMKPSVLLLGLVVILGGGIDLLPAASTLSLWASMICTVFLPFGVLILYAVRFSKARSRYW